MPRKWLIHNSILLILREIKTNNSREKMEVYIQSDTFHCICKFTYETKLLEACKYPNNVYIPTKLVIIFLFGKKYISCTICSNMILCIS